MSFLNHSFFETHLFSPSLLARIWRKAKRRRSPICRLTIKTCRNCTECCRRKTFRHVPLWVETRSFSTDSRRGSVLGRGSSVRDLLGKDVYNGSAVYDVDMGAKGSGAGPGPAPRYGVEQGGFRALPPDSVEYTPWTIAPVCLELFSFLLKIFIYDSDTPGR